MRFNRPRRASRHVSWQPSIHSPHVIDAFPSLASTLLPHVATSHPIRGDDASPFVVSLSNHGPGAPCGR